MTVYDFNRQLGFGQHGENFLDAFLADDYAIVDPQRQRDGIDRQFTHRGTGVTFTVEIKTDRTAARTNNAFVETVSVDRAGKRGWAYTSQAAYLLYWIPGLDVLYVVQFDALRAELPRWIREFPERSIPNRDYHTIGVCVPLDEFERIAEDVVITPVEVRS